MKPNSISQFTVMSDIESRTYMMSLFSFLVWSTRSWKKIPHSKMNNNLTLTRLSLFTPIPLLFFHNYYKQIFHYHFGTLSFFFHYNIIYPILSPFLLVVFIYLFFIFPSFSLFLHPSFNERWRELINLREYILLL